MLFGLSIFLSTSIASATSENQSITNETINQSTSDYSLNNSTTDNSSQQSDDLEQNNQPSTNADNTNMAAAGGDSSVKFTNEQIIESATWVKNYVDTNHTLPNSVTINNIQVSINSFYYLLSTVVQNIYNNNNNPVNSISFNDPQAYQDNILSGTMTLSEYIHIADVTKVYMDKTGVVPGYATSTSLGPYCGYKSLIYMFCTVLDNYNTTKTLPNSVSVKPWKTLSDPNLATFTNEQIIESATWVKNYVDTNHTLPNSVTINNIQVSINSFYYLLSTVVQNIYNNNNNPVNSISFNDPQAYQDNILSGTMTLSEYIHIADVTKVYMDKTGVVPGYATSTSLGPYLSYQSMIYIFCTVLDNYDTTKTLPSSVVVKPWYNFTVDQIAYAATWVKDYIDTNHKLPSSVTIGSLNVEMPSFLYLLSVAVQNVYNKNYNNVVYNYCNPPQLSKDGMNTGNMALSEYVHIADQIKVYSDSTGVIPGYAYDTSLGTYFGFNNMIYTYSKIMAYYSVNGVLPNYVEVQPAINLMKPFFGSVPDDLVPYTLATKNCQSNNQDLVNFAYSLTANASSAWEAASIIMNWVRDNIDYAFYYNTVYGALGTFNNGQGNCCDHAHLVIALARAVGIPARYVHGDCTFSSGTYGHVWAQLYVGGTWYNADATSSRNSLGVINNWNTNTYTLKGIYRELTF